MYAPNKREMERWRTALIAHGALWQSDVERENVMMADGSEKNSDELLRPERRRYSKYLQFFLFYFLFFFFFFLFYL
jgi:hypothetical protein